MVIVITLLIMIFLQGQGILGSRLSMKWQPRACVRCKVMNDRCSGDQCRKVAGRGGVRAAVGECDGLSGGRAADVQEHEL